MPAPLSDRAPIVDGTGRPQRTFIRYLQELFNGVIQRQGYTAAQLATMTPTAFAEAYCSDSSTTTFHDVVAGGGSNVVRVHGDGTNWRVG
ncbi:hypothetical protein [Reyranella sp.]|uniref:hypothetical protein n=1 Tax=Reyranella sp. TaxID=1929291 RepID=UPI00121E3DFB|nr:hypothetical protein [Reyranella sp.]TAJ89735.1 MAG: hypothetical protein EPO50_05050 [Reyranella sp.]